MNQTTPTFRLLGQIAICASGGRWVEVSPAKQRVLLTTLLLNRNEWVSSSRLVYALWGEAPPKSAIGNLKTYIWRLRAMLNDLTDINRVESRPGCYRLTAARADLDIVLFEDLVQLGDRALAEGDPARAAEHLGAALGLWHADPFDDSLMPLVEAHLAALRELFHTAQERYVEAQLRLGCPEGVIPMLRRMVVEHPLRERSWAQLIRALTLVGRRADAISAYQDVRGVLERELGLAPDSEIRAAFTSTLRT